LTIVGAGPESAPLTHAGSTVSGHAVGLIARNGDRLDAETRRLRQQGIDPDYALVDVSDPGAVGAAMNALQRRFGSAEVLYVSPLPDRATINNHA
jgi:NADP-dependent 3-hydroxy acid dehydrogenase YdfG